MASKLELVEYIAEQFSDAGTITYRKMFGEYGIYCNGKFFASVCDDNLFIKITDEVKKAFPDLKQAPPYDGAKPNFLIENIDDREFLTTLAQMTCKALSESKKRGK